MPKQTSSGNSAKNGASSGSRSTHKGGSTGSARKPPARTSAAPQRGGSGKDDAANKAGSTRNPLSPRAAPPLVYRRPRTWLADTRTFFALYGRELFAMLLIVAGIALLLTLPGELPSWPERLFGWTAALVALTLVVVGVVLILGPRAGYWSAEALVGAELLLLALQAGTWVRTAGRLGGEAYARDGSSGGIMGWALGSLLVNALGYWLALLLIIMIGLAGLLMLLRYTPALYGVAMVARRVESWRLRRDQRAAWAAEWDAYAAGAEDDAGPGADPETTAATDARLAAGNQQPQSQPYPPQAAAQGSIPPAVKPAPAAQGAPATPRPAGKPAKAGKTPVANPPGPEVSGPPNPGGLLLPSVELLASDRGTYAETNTDDLQRRIEQTLEDFDVPVRVVHVESGPTVTQFGVEPLYIERAGQKRKVRVSRILALADDLALALAAPAVRIEAPVPGRAYVGIEVPNMEKSVVSLRGILETSEFSERGGNLALPMGRNTSGAPIVVDLGRAPHMLIAGATGSGKSVCINAMIMGLLMRHSPASLRFLMVDPKRVELTAYNGIPHLIGNVITDVDQVMAALTWLTLQMDDRYRLFNGLGVRNIDTYNALAGKSTAEGAPLERLPYIVLIVDELADLMMTAAEDVERQLCRLAQLARATGIHLVLATQRPSVDVVTGLIKANFPTRVAFAVSSSTDSRVILDAPGAERLLGRGDMLLMRPDAAKLLRVQGCLVTDDEIGRIVDFWLAQAPPGAGPARVPWAGLIGREDDGDELVQEAIDALEGVDVCSTSMLQRKLRIGYPRAARLMEQLEHKGIVGPDMGGGQGREVLIKRNRDEDLPEPGPDAVSDWDWRTETAETIDETGDRIHGS